MVIFVSAIVPIRQKFRPFIVIQMTFHIPVDVQSTTVSLLLAKNELEVFGSIFGHIIPILVYVSIYDSVSDSTNQSLQFNFEKKIQNTMERQSRAPIVLYSC